MAERGERVERAKREARGTTRGSSPKLKSKEVMEESCKD